MFATITGCFPCHVNDPAMEAACLAGSVLIARKSQPTQAGPAFDVPDRPLEIASTHYRFVMPKDFGRDPDSKRQVFRDAHRLHAVRIEVYDFAGSPAQFVDERYPESTRYTLKLATREALAMTVAGADRRVTAVVIAAHGKTFELACSQEAAIIGNGADVTCHAVLRTFDVT